MKLGQFSLVFLVLFNLGFLLNAVRSKIRYNISDVAAAVNLARTKPQEFKEYMTKTWWDNLDSKEGVCVLMNLKIRIRMAEACPAQFDSMFEFYKKQEPLPALKLNKAVTWGAYKHAKYLATVSHTAGHNGPNTFLDRYGDRYSNIPNQGVAENVMYEERTEISAKYMIGIFILDDGVLSRGHRLNIYRGYDNLGVGMAADSNEPDKIYLVLGFSKNHDCGKCNEIPEEDVKAMGWYDGINETGEDNKTEEGNKTDETSFSGYYEPCLALLVLFVILQIGF